MTDLLEQAFAALRKMPRQSQDEIARAVLRLAADNAAPEAVDANHLAALREGLGQAMRGEFATDQEVQAAFRRIDS